MLSAIAFVPAAPLLAPEVSGPGAHDVEPLRDAAAIVAGRLGEVADTWWVIGAGAVSDDRDVPLMGSFSEFGVRLTVSLTPGRPDESLRADTSTRPGGMPTPLLVAGWLRGSFAPHARIRPLLTPVDALPGDCMDRAAELVARIDGGFDDGRGVGASESVGVLVMADGSTGLTERAPGGLIPDAADVQAAADAALSTGDLDAVAGLDERRCAHARLDGRAAWQIAAQVWRLSVGTRPTVESLYAAAPFGVGYHVAWWSR